MKKKYTADDSTAPGGDDRAARLQNLTVKEILITGATDGIGKELALSLAEQDFHIHVHGRDASKAKNLLASIRQKNPEAAGQAFVADFSDLASVRKMAMHATLPRLDILVNNAGVYMSHRELTPDGYETTFQVNHLSHFLLTLLLKDLLAPSDGCVLNVASMAHSGASGTPDDWLIGSNFNAYTAYANSKLANILFTQTLHKTTGLATISLHPGVIATKLLQTGWGMAGSPLSEGAETLMAGIRACTHDNSPAYFSGRKKATPSAMAANERLANELWAVSLRATGMEK